MSDIKRYGVWDKPPREDLVTYADHEAAIALRTRVCAEAFEDELARTEEQVLADAKARIGRLAAPNGSYGEAEWGFLRGVTAALAALTQPQTEGCPEDCDGFGRLIGDSDGPCPACSGLESDGGGAATAAGVADADLEAAAMEISVKATRLDPETYKVPDKLIWMLRSALFPNEDMERIKSPGPYAKAFREKFPVPEFPGIKNRQEDQA